jgi:hypothetical protein
MLLCGECYENVHIKGTQTIFYTFNDKQFVRLKV